MLPLRDTGCNIQSFHRAVAGLCSKRLRAKGLPPSEGQAIAAATPGFLWLPCWLRGYRTCFSFFPFDHFFIYLLPSVIASCNAPMHGVLERTRMHAQLMPLHMSAALEGIVCQLHNGRGLTLPFQDRAWFRAECACVRACMQFLSPIWVCNAPPRGCTYQRRPPAAVPLSKLADLATWAHTGNLHACSQ